MEDIHCRLTFLLFTEKMKKNENVDWILSPEGQRIIENNGYVPLKN